MSATPILGIDPGLGGGLAIVGKEFSRTWKMPETERDLLDTLEDVKTFGVTTAFLEFVRSSPQMGVVSAFKFGSGYGGLRMACIASGLRLEEVTPQKWQKALGCRTGGDKNVSKRRAQELFPGVKVTHAIADALLIAEYGLRVTGGARMDGARAEEDAA
jgi:Holliday junction resolvasome RuvABC endonuclease subunit